MTTWADRGTEDGPLIVAILGGYDGAYQIAKALKGYATVVEVDSAEALLEYLDDHRDAQIPQLLVNSDRVDVGATLDRVYRDPRFAGTRNVVLTGASEHHDLASAIDAGHLHALVRIPVRRNALQVFVVSQLHSWMSRRGLEPIPLLEEKATLTRASNDLLTNLSVSEDELTDRLVAAVDAALERRPRIFLPRGVRLTRQGAELTYVFIVIEGHVALTRSTSSEDLLLHHASTGRVVGILSLAGEDTSFFTSTTTTDAEVIILSLDQLQSAMRRDPDVASGLAVSAIRALSQRLIRAEQLQIERNELIGKLGREHKRLKRALKKLKEARMELISQAKFATLGELSAGIAHELNNPITALIAAAGHLLADMESVMSSHPKGQLLIAVAESARHHSPLSTAEERAIRRQIERITKSSEMAFRLVAAGVTDPQTTAGLRESDLELIEAAASIGTATRNVATASARIAELVRSLRSYARPENELMDDVDVRETIDETLALLVHRLRGIDVIKEYQPLPSVKARPSQLGQIWTNLLVNAADVLDEGGRIEISASRLDDDHVQVEVLDNGPGIPPRILGRIFEPRFTTKHGTVRYGMGMGLSLTRTLVEGHGGSISVESQPGRTAFTVILPIDGPLSESEMSLTTEKPLTEKEES